MEFKTTLQSPKLTTIDKVGGILCHLCNVVHSDKKNIDTHYKAVHNANKDQTIYTCVICQKQFPEYASLRGHCYNNHFIFRCDSCNKTFKKKVMLKDHINRCHTHKCSTCGKRFPSKTEYHLHQIIHNEQVSSTECTICKETILTIDECKRHIKEHFKYTYTCPICNEVIEKDNASQHFSIHFGNAHTTDCEDPGATDDEKLMRGSTIEAVGGAVCDVCNKTFNDKEEFDFHYLKYHKRSVISYSCNVCAKQYHNFNELIGHCYKDHVAKRAFTCDACAETFPRLSSLLLHNESHAGGEQSHICPLCSMNFASELRLRTHRAVAHWQPPADSVYCPLDGCGHLYESKKDQIAHQRTHSFNPNNWCRQCGMQFTSAFDCEIHMDVHKTKTYQCPMCSKIYREEHCIMNHIKPHFLTSVHICKVCGKSYTTYSRLVQHMKVHSATKNYKCNFCDKSFVKKDHLEQHTHIHLGIKPYKCIVCSKTFASFANWSKHLKRMHNICHKDLDQPKIQWENIKDNKIYQVNNNDIIKAPKNIKECMTVNQQMKYAEPIQLLDAKVCLMKPSKQVSLEYLSKETLIVKSNQKVEQVLKNLEKDVSMPLQEQKCNKEQFGFQDEDPGEFTNVLHELNTFSTEPTSNEPITAETTSYNQVYPREYGPDFLNTYCNYSGQCFGSDDHIMMPHIDPLLIINPKVPQFDQAQTIDHMSVNTFDHLNHEAPIIKDCLFSYPINRLIMNTN